MPKQQSSSKAASRAPARRGSRQPKIICVFGTTGTGKSWFAKEIIRQIGNPTVVVTLAGMQDTWAEYPKLDPTSRSAWEFSEGIKELHWYEQGNDTGKYILHRCRNKTLVFDDCKDVLQNNLQAVEGMKSIFALHRHMGNDIIVIAHSPKDIPPQVWQYNKLTFVFHTDATFRNADLPIQSAGEIRQAQERVRDRYYAAKRAGKPLYGIFEIVEP